MYDEDTFVVLDGKKVRRSEFSASSFDFGLPEHERGIAAGRPAEARRWSR